MRRLVPRLVASLGLGALVLASGCGGGARDVARVTTTSSSEEGRGRPAASRTIDNAGFVDNAGRTSTETARTEMSGMRASELGSERPTGTPASGAMVPPIDPNGPGADVTQGEGAGAASTVRGPREITPSGAPEESAVARIARARCDQATACGHVASSAEGGAKAPPSAGPTRETPTHASQEACMTHERPRAQQDIADAGCTNGVDGVQLGICLTAIRQADCRSRPLALDDIQACRASALCAPR